MTGILLVDKPADWTSHDVVAKLRGITRERRIGHSGTLDPMATGLLVVFLGRATRAVEYAEADEKTYVADLRLGLTTDTQDTTGNILTDCADIPGRETVEQALTRFHGAIEQIPPMYSAIKRDGKKLYELARKGIEVERKPRPVTIHALEILQGSGNAYKLLVRCSKGTYIRTLCHDIGQSLGCGGCMSGLRRTDAGVFSVAGAYSMEQLIAAENIEALLLPVDSLFADKPACTVSGKAVRLVRNGNDIAVPELPEGTYRVYDPEGGFLMLGQVENGVMKTLKSFFEV